MELFNSFSEADKASYEPEEQDISAKRIIMCAAGDVQIFKFCPHGML